MLQVFEYKLQTGVNNTNAHVCAIWISNCSLIQYLTQLKDIHQGDKGLFRDTLFSLCYRYVLGTLVCPSLNRHDVLLFVCHHYSSKWNGRPCSVKNSRM